MQRLNIILPIIFFFFIFELVAQKSYQIPDGNFRSKLIISYPNLMVGGELDSAAAANFTGILNLQSANISDLDGIQYFSKLPELNINDNKLTFIPQISALKELRYLFVARNQLDTLPDLSELKKIVEIQVQYNNLKEIPPLDGLQELSKFYCNDNHLTYLPDLVNLQKLQVLVIGNNPFQVQPDFSGLKNLIELHVHQTGCDSIQGLSNLKKLQVLYAWNNKIKVLPALDSITDLRILNIYDNQFTDLPYLLNKPFLIYLSITNNYLTFEDIKPLKAMTYFNYFTYIPQKRLKVDDVYVREKESVLLQLDIDTTVSSNSYSWYKMGQKIDVTTKPIKQLSNIQFSDSGFYYLTITNPEFPDFVLKTDSFKVSVNPCVEIIGYTVRTDFIDCSAGFEVNIDDLNYQGASDDVVFQILKNGRIISESDSEPVFSGVASGLYTFQITNNKTCSDKFNFTIDSKSDCDQVFTPNGDGVMDSYFIETKGVVKIYDMSRRLIAELNAPISWDGTTKDGRLAESGLYAIVLSTGEIIQVTIIK